MRNAFAIHNIELSLSERRCYLVLDNLNTGTAADNIVAVFQRVDTTYIHTDGRVEFQCAATGSGFRITEHNANLFTDLVDENSSTFGFGNQTCQLTQSLTHQTCLQAYVGITHFAFDFGTRNQSCNGVDNDNINSAAAYQCVSNFQSLFAVIRLRNQQIVNIYTQMTGIFRIQCMLRIDKCRIAAHLLSFGNHMQSNGSFTGRFGTVNLNNTSARNTTDTKSNIQG